MRARVLLMVTVAGLASAFSRAGEPVKVSVSSVAGQSVFLDKGRTAGVAPGLHVRLFPPGGQPIDVIVADVSASSARIEFPVGLPLPPVGCVGELDVPDAPAAAPAPGQPPARTIPQHPPWTRPEDARSADAPLLAPAFSRPASERASTFHGRVFTQMQYALDRSGDSDNTYLLARLGASFDLTNPFGKGGTLSFSGEVDQRGASVVDTTDEHETRFLLDQLSYTMGGEQYSSYRLEVGRFTSFYLPEIGTVDGAEGAILLQNGLSIGGAVGAYPRPYPDTNWGKDLGFHVFVDYKAPGDGDFAGTVGFLKTWHDGAPDRDAIIARFNAMPTKSLWFFGSCTIDIYGSGSDLKPAGPQLTQAWLQARYSPDSRKGVSLSYSRYTWPDIKSWEWQFTPVELIRDGRLDRVELSGWYELVKDFRLTARGNYFKDLHGDGTGAELDADWYQVMGVNAALHGDVFYSDGSYTSGDGFRIECRPGNGDIQGWVGYELFRYKNTGSIADSEQFTRHTIRGGLSLQRGKWSYNLSLDRYFGDAEDAYSLGAYVEYRF